MFRNIFGSFCNLFTLMGVLTLWTCSRLFSKTLRDDICAREHGDVHYHPVSSWIKIDREYKCLLKLADKINEAIGLNVTCFLVIQILDLSTTFHDAFLLESVILVQWNKILRLVFYSFFAFTIVYFSVDVAKHMRVMKEWLTFPVYSNSLKTGQKWNHNAAIRCIPADRIQLYLYDLETHAISIKASNIFPLTYSSLANVGRACINKMCKHYLTHFNLLPIF